MLMAHSSHDNFHEPEDKEDVTIFQSTSDDGAERGVAREDVDLMAPVELNLTDPHFMAEAYDIYADLRAKGPVSRVRFTGLNEEEAKGHGEEQPDFFGCRETFFVTHYDEVIKTLLDE